MENELTLYRKRISFIVERMTGQKNEDLAQEIYLKTWQNLKNYQEQGKFKGWVSSVARNMCRDFKRSKGERQRAITAGEEVLESLSVQAMQEEALIRKQRQKKVLEAVSNLPKKLREVIVLSEFHDNSLEEVAKRLKIPVGTVKSRLFNAKKHLKEDLKEFEGENL